jgi:hypothetical protein
MLKKPIQAGKVEYVEVSSNAHTGADADLSDGPGQGAVAGEIIELENEKVSIEVQKI